MSGDATSVSDLVQLAESISSVMSAATDVNDNIEVSEGVDSLMSGGVGVASEVVEVVENVTSVMSGDAASTSEILEIAEDITMALGVAGWPFNVYDVLTILEDIQARTDLADVGIFDSLEIQESLTLSLTSLVTPTPVAKKKRRGSGGAARPAIKNRERLLREDEEVSLTIMNFVRWFHERSA
jgi:hypothetical protein